MTNNSIEVGKTLDRRQLLVGAAAAIAGASLTDVREVSAQSEELITNEELGMTFSLEKPTNVGGTVVEFLPMSDGVSSLHFPDVVSHAVVFVDEGKSLIVDGQVGTHDDAPDDLMSVHMGYKPPVDMSIWATLQEVKGTIAVAPVEQELNTMDSLHGDKDHLHIVSDHLQDEFETEKRPDYYAENFTILRSYDGEESTESSVVVLVEGERGADVTLESFEPDADVVLNPQEMLPNGNSEDAKVTVTSVGARVVFSAE